MSTKKNTSDSVSTQAEIPEYCTSAGIAKLIGKSVRRIQQITADGIISTEKQPGLSRKYKTADTVQKYIEYIEKKQKEDANGKEALELKKLQAEIALKESQGELHRLKTEIASGKYISLEDIKLDYEYFFAIFKKFAMSLPSRVCSQLTGYMEPVALRALEKELNADIVSALKSFVVAAVEKDN